MGRNGWEGIGRGGAVGRFGRGGGAGGRFGRGGGAGGAEGREVRGLGVPWAVSGQKGAIGGDSGVLY